MFSRKIEQNLLEWKNRTGRRPLIIRGARQTGKTTIIRRLGGQFTRLVELNLEKDAVRRLFDEVREIREVVQSIEGLTNQRIVPGETLLFLDEIQNSVSAIKLLRYFHEEMPDLHLIAAGSLLEVRMRKEGWSFPVGRVEFLYLYPVTFEEFLSVLGEEILLQVLRDYSPGRSFPTPLHEKLSNLVADYMIVGGLPQAVADYSLNRSFASVGKYHEALFSSFKEDFAKYSRGPEVECLKRVWDRIPFEIGNRIQYSKIAGSHTASNAISRAFDILHEAMLVERIFPTTQRVLPLVIKPKAAPKALFLDIGLCSYVLHLTRDQVKEKLLDPHYGGALFEEWVGQEMLALDFHNRNPLYFWVREEKGASSELDFLMQVANRLVPVEVKSGSHGSLKSLHQFLHRSGTAFGIRICNRPPQVEDHLLNTPDGSRLRYKLLTIPFYLAFRLPELCVF